MTLPALSAFFLYWYTSRVFAALEISDRIREARIDGILAIRLEDGRWVSMPEWLGRGDTLSARKQIGKRIVL